MIPHTRRPVPKAKGGGHSRAEYGGKMLQNGNAGRSDRMSKAPSDVERSYQLAREQYARLGVSVERAIETLQTVAISLHCWQGDDVSGFENPAGLTGGGIQATGNYPGKARNADELRADLDRALSLIPGKHRLNLHAIYAEYSGRRI